MTKRPRKSDREIAALPLSVSTAERRARRRRAGFYAAVPRLDSPCRVHPGLCRPSTFSLCRPWLTIAA